MQDDYIVGKGTPLPWRTDPWIVMGETKKHCSLIVVPPNNLRDFIDPQNHDCRTRLIYGPKGSGKSALLVAKRVLLEKEAEAHKVICIPSAFPKVFTSPGIAEDKVTFHTWEKVSEYAVPETWAHLWKLVFGSYVVATLEKERRQASAVGQRENTIEDSIKEPLLPKKLGTLLIGNDYKVENDLGTRNANKEFIAILRHIIEKSTVSPDNLSQAFDEYIAPTYKKLAVEADHKPIYIFVDAVDELLRGPVEFSDFLTLSKSGFGKFQDQYLGKEKLNSEGARDLAMRLWSCAQVSLIAASLNMASETRGCVRLIGTLRSEAHDKITFSKGPTQIGDLVKEVKYSKTILATIFNENIKACEKARMIDPGATDQIQRFMGATAYIHNSTKKQEFIFSALLRHTFEEPRDLMVLGQALYDLSKDERKDSAIVREVVNQKAEVVLKDYLEYMGEAWDRELATLTFRKIDGNILTKRQVHTIRDEVIKQSNGKIEHPFCYLYSLGLIGVPVSDGNSKQMRQEFLLPARFKHADGDNTRRYCLPETEYYFIHPALAERIRQVRHTSGLGFTPHGEEIIGDGLPWDKDIDLMQVYLRRHLDTNGVTHITQISLKIDSHELGHDDENPTKKGIFSTLNDSATFIFVSMLLALQKNRFSSEKDVDTNEMTQEQFQEAAAFLCTQTQVNKKTKSTAPPLFSGGHGFNTKNSRKPFDAKLIDEVNAYLSKAGSSKKYPNSLTTIRSRLRAEGINKIDIGIQGLNLYINGIPPNEMRIKGFGEWDN